MNNLILLLYLFLPLVFIFLFMRAVGGGRSQVDKIRDTRPIGVKGWIFLIVFFSSIAASYHTLSKNSRVTKMDSLREQFLLPPDIELLDFGPGERSGQKSGRISFNARAQFSPRQWEDYIAKLDDTSLWQAVPFKRGDLPNPFTKHSFHIIDGDYPPNARTWTDPPKPLKGDAEKGIYSYADASWLDNIWRDQGEAQPENGKIMCYMFQTGYRKSSPLDFLLYDEAERNIPDSPGRQPLDLKVSACSDLARSEGHSAYVLGILDFDKKTLRMIVE